MVQNSLKLKKHNTWDNKFSSNINKYGELKTTPRNTNSNNNK